MRIKAYNYHNVISGPNAQTPEPSSLMSPLQRSTKAASQVQGPSSSNGTKIPLCVPINPIYVISTAMAYDELLYDEHGQHRRLCILAPRVQYKNTFTLLSDKLWLYYNLSNTNFQNNHHYSFINKSPWCHGHPRS